MGTDNTNTEAADWIWASDAATELASAQGLENHLAKVARAKRILRELCIAINNAELKVYAPGVTGVRVERPARNSEPEFPTGDYPIKRSSLEAWWQSQQPTTQHAAPQMQIRAQTKADQLPPEWIRLAQEQAKAIYKRQKAVDLYPNQLIVAEEIAGDFRSREIFGKNGIPLTAEYIKRHALTGISGAKGRQLSTSSKQGKQGKK